MQHVITLIAGPGAEAALRDCVAALGGTGDWLAPSACDLVGIADEAARLAIAGRPIDIIAQPAEGRRKKLLVADLESTIIENEMLEELADFLGLRAPVAEITRRAMNGEIGFDRIVANRLDIVDGKLAGTVSPPIVTSATKRDTLVALAGELGIGLDATLAVGDGANDLPMLQAAGLGVAFRAKPAVAAAARWRIDHSDLTALLYAQGYRQEEIAAT